MRTVDVAWDSADERFTASGTHQGRTIHINAPHGSDTTHSPTGFSASELLLAGVGACAAWDVVEILQKARQRATGLEVSVRGEQDADPPWAYRHVTAHFLVRGDRLRPSVVERAVSLSCGRYCSVIATIRGVAKVDWTVEVAQEASSSAPESRLA